ncbi:glycosyltransferase [Crocosphaera sp.]|uniref:glycosyltransferase n=1 Tax=Crocosphaera sp. TaxID=2729996 RepID=UPI003F5A79F2|nr:glycosyltransferase [Crocosphaera sp.]
MKIAYLMNTHPYASCTFIRREITALEANGVSVERFAIRSPNTAMMDEADQQEIPKTRVILNVGGLGVFLAVVKTVVTNLFGFLSMFFFAVRIGWRSETGVIYNLIYLAEACVLQQWLSQSKITHIHVHFATNATTVAMFCQGLGGPSYSFTVHGPHEFDKVQAIALPEKIKHAAFVVAISSYGKSQLYRWCEFKDWDKIKIVHCGVDDGFLTVSSPPFPEKPCFVSVGRLSEQKGQYLLIEAVSKLVSQGYDFKLILVGDGELREPIEAAINRFNLQDTVEITGWATQADVQKYILQSWAMVLPSFAEGLPVVIMESLALGRPVISTYIAGIPELVIPEKSGWLVTPGSVEGLVDGMKTVLETPKSQLEEMGKIGAEMVKQEHNVNREAQKLKQLFSSIH